MNTVTIYPDQTKNIIHKNIYGHFAEHLGRCIYDGFWVGEQSPIPNVRGIRSDVVEALRKIKIPVLRWPGGCFADEYHWQDGIGPRIQRPVMVNTNWGHVTENNHFGTHEFMDLCHQLGAEPYITGNVGSGSVHEMQQWVEYLTFDGKSPMADLRRKNGRNQPWQVTYWGVGNENWGCGGNMRVEYYADLYRHYATFLKNFSTNKLYKIACGAGNVFSNMEKDLFWTELLLREASALMDGLSLHYYTVTGTWENKGSAIQFDEKEWFTAIKKALWIEDLLLQHSAVMDRYDPQKRIGLIVDEWGAWHDPEPGTNPHFLFQQNSLRDAMIAALTFNIFNRNSSRIQMANLAQTVNVLQAPILTKGDKILLTPTYHVFDLFSEHQNARLLQTETNCNFCQTGSDKIPALSVSASQSKENHFFITLCNVNPNSGQDVQLHLKNSLVKKASGRIITGSEMNIHNTFDEPNAITPKPFSSFTLNKDKIDLILPSKSITALEVEYSSRKPHGEPYG